MTRRRRQTTPLPDDVLTWAKGVFRACNEAVASKMSRIPTVHETSLDLTLIERFSQFAVPIELPSRWIVRIDTHYLGGGRHFGEWEIADLGVLLIVRRGGKVILTKLTLLQSKRLYPDEQDFSEDHALDYMIGFGRLLRGDDPYPSITSPRSFTFSSDSRYKAFKVGSTQFEAIRRYEQATGIPVHYLLYHPLVLPFTANIPIAPVNLADAPCEVGCRVIGATAVNNSLGKFDPPHLPSYSEICSIPDEATAGGTQPGRRLEDFFVDRFVSCREGYVASEEPDEGLVTVFNRRSGPIAAAIAITFDGPA